MKKKLTLSELKVSSFTTLEGGELRGGLEKLVAEGDSIANCATDCIGRYCEPEQDFI